MGFIPLFLTMGGACLLFFLTVRSTLQNKLNKQREMLSQIGLKHPELGLILGELVNPDTVLEKWKTLFPQKEIPKKILELVRELKINQYQYNQLVKKAPYNWIAFFGGFKPI
jgi:hypothetical protein